MEGSGLISPLPRFLLLVKTLSNTHLPAAGAWQAYVRVLLSHFRSYFRQVFLAAPVCLPHKQACLSLLNFCFSLWNLLLVIMTLQLLSWRHSRTTWVPQGQGLPCFAGPGVQRLFADCLNEHTAMLGWIMMLRIQLSQQGAVPSILINRVSNELLLAIDL